VTLPAAPWLRQWWADLLAAFWLRPAAMTLLAILLAEALVRLEGWVELPGWLGRWVYAGAVGGARDVLGTVAGATIGVAGTTFSITVATLTLASSQMGPRLLRNFTRDPGNQYALGALLATFAYSLVVLRSVQDADAGAFVPELAVSVALLFGFACVGVLIWFIHHVAVSISVDRVVAQVAEDLMAELHLLPLAAADEEAPAIPRCAESGAGAPLRTPGAGGYLRVLDDAALADWAAERDAVVQLRVRPGDFAFPAACLGEVWPASEGAAAQLALDSALAFGDTRTAEQDPEAVVRQLVEIALRALSPGINDPFTAVAVLDRLGAALCTLAARSLPDGRTVRDGTLRVTRPAIDHGGLMDTMFHPIRQAGAAQPVVVIRLLEVLGEVAAVERNPSRLDGVRRHAALARTAALAQDPDPSVRAAVEARHAQVLQFAAAEG
jgi:uncharacterized membrane protein